MGRILIFVGWCRDCSNFVKIMRRVFMVFGKL